MRNPMTAGGAIALALMLLFAAALAWFASATPRPLPANAPADRFASGRAFQDIEAMAAAPHPVGSPQNARVRDQLIARLVALGLQPQVQRQDGVTPWTRHPWSGRSSSKASAKPFTVENILARFAGGDPHAPALLVMSHYDSVPKSPGAADDMAGVASALEIIRLLKQTPPPARDVLFVFTDGEEAGLLGAKAFFDTNRAAQHVGFVVNMEARGGGGRALMFQTSPNARGAERLFAKTAAQPESNSLSAFIYTHMPNDTDFSVAMAHGAPGLNYAFLGRPQLYHTPIAVPAAVEPGAVQSLGTQAWAAVDALAHAQALPAPGPDLVWFDLFGRAVIHYPPALGWAPVLLAAGLLIFAAWAQGRRSLPSSGAMALDTALGAVQSLAATVLAGVGLYLYGLITITGYYQAMAHPWRTEIVAVAATLGASLLVFRRSKSTRPLARWLGAALIALLIAAGLQAAAPAVAYLAAWPTLLAAAALALTSAAPEGEAVDEPPGEPHDAPKGAALAQWLAFLACAVGLGFLMEAWHVMVLGVGLILPPVGAALLPLALAVLAPVLMRPRR